MMLDINKIIYKIINKLNQNSANTVYAKNSSAPFCNFKLAITFKLKFIAMLSSIIFSQMLMASSTDISNLENQLKLTHNQDRLLLLKDLTTYYSLESPPKAKKYGEEALELLEKFPDTALQLHVGHYLFDAYRKLSQLDRAYKLAFNNLALAMNNGTLEQKAEANFDISNILSDKNSDYKGAIKYLEISCRIFKQLNDNLSLGSCLNNQGLAYYYDTQYEKAIEFYINALKIAEYKMELAAAHTLGNIALINMQYRRWEQALIYYHQALEHAKLFNKNAMISEQLINIGVAYLFNDELDKSIAYFDKATILQKGIGNIRSSFIIAKRLGEVYVEKQNYTKAMQYYQEAFNLSQKMSSDSSYIEIIMATGVLNTKLQKYDLAIINFEKALKRAKKTKRKPYIYEAHENLYLTNKDLGNLSKSLFHYEKYIQLKTEKTQKDRLNKITELEERFKAQQRETQIQLLKKENQLEALRNQRIQYASVFIVAFLFALAFLWVLRQKQLSSIANERTKMMEELIVKKNQLLADVSHELGTPLTVLKLQVESLKDDLEDDIQACYDALDNKINDIEHLIEDIHQLAQSDVGILKMCRVPFELHQTLNFWHTELAHFVSKNDLTFEMDNSVSHSLEVNFDKERIKQIIINLLNNSIKYTDKQGRIRLSVSQVDDTLYLSIEDSKPGVSDKDLTNIFERLYRVENSRNRSTGGSGLGLAICKSLVESHNGKIYAQHSSLGGLKVTTELPIEA